MVVVVSYFPKEIRILSFQVVKRGSTERRLALFFSRNTEEVCVE